MAATTLQALLTSWAAVDPKVSTANVCLIGRTFSRVQIVDAGAGVDQVELREVPFRTDGEADGAYATRIASIDTFQVVKAHILSVTPIPTP